MSPIVAILNTRSTPFPTVSPIFIPFSTALPTRFCAFSKKPGFLVCAFSHALLWFGVMSSDRGSNSIPPGRGASTAPAISLATNSKGAASPILVNITMEGNKIRVRLPNNQGFVEAVVSPEDLPALTAPGMNWRLGSSGYPMFVRRVNKELTTVWMHKLVVGGPATHINGNRLDCRRENLVPSCRKSPFQIKTPDSVWDSVEEFEGGDRDLRFYTGFASVKYDLGKVYSGQVVHGRPHGFGSLIEPVDGKHSSGNWVDGSLRKGMVVEYEYSPRVNWSERRVKHIQLINVC